MKKIFLLIPVLFSFYLTAQTTYRTRIINPNIKTLQIGVMGVKLGLPIIELNSTQALQISFDEMSHSAHSYTYKVLHCNADWIASDLSTNEYLSAYTTGNITDYNLSVNTTYLYTHYIFRLPNNDMGFKISGNFVVIIYEDNELDKPVAEACFSVVDPKVSITTVVRGNTDTELSGRLQQLDFEIELNGYSVRDAASEIKVVVRQNNRFDNEVKNLKPTYMSNSKLSFINNKSLIFEGGSEFHRFDISSVYAASEGVAAIKYMQPHYEVFMTEDKIQTSKTYQQDFDVNGKFIINMQDTEEDDVEADYMLVHFTLPTAKPFFDGQIYLGGEFNYNQMNDAFRMNYDNNAGAYVQTLMLKQGGYNYQYWFLPKGERKASSERIGGSYWQTGNEYTIYVYHRAWGERYDRLIGVKGVE